jgi:hypothetical protein
VNLSSQIVLWLCLFAGLHYINIMWVIDLLHVEDVCICFLYGMSHCYSFLCYIFFPINNLIRILIHSSETVCSTLYVPSPRNRICINIYMYQNFVTVSENLKLHKFRLP